MTPQKQLYPQSYKIHKIMGKLIDEYFQNHLQLTWDEAVELHNRYYKDYGLALVGLLRHHKIDALEYNSKVDDALPLVSYNVVCGFDRVLRGCIRENTSRRTPRTKVCRKIL